MLEEAAVLSRMSQSSIVSLLSLDTLPSYHYLVLEVGAVMIKSKALSWLIQSTAVLKS